MLHIEDVNALSPSERARVRDLMARGMDAQVPDAEQAHKLCDLLRVDARDTVRRELSGIYAVQLED